MHLTGPPLVIVLVLLYGVTGHLGLLLAIPPGYATALFPPAGLALAARLQFGRVSLVGIWLGSFLLNLSIGWLDQGPPSALGLGLAAGIGLGASLQAEAGHALLRRLQTLPLRWDDEQHLLRFAVLATVSTTVSATVGVGLLTLAGGIPIADSGYSWLTWWVGDSIGVLLLTPIALMAMASENSRRQLKTIVVPVAVSFVLITILFFQASKWEQLQHKNRFDNLANQVEQELVRQLERQLLVLQLLERFFSASAAITAQDFADFVAPLVAGNSGVVSYSWVPRVANAELPAFVRQQRAHLPEYQLWERDGTGGRAPVAVREAHWPIAYIEPASNHWLLGYDNGSEPVRAATLHAALRDRDFRVSPPLQLQQLGPGQVAVLLAYPLATQAQAVVAGIRLKPLLDLALTNMPQQEGLQVRLQDLSSDGAELAVSGTANEQRRAAGNLFQYQTKWRVAGRDWQLSVSASPLGQYQRAWQSWLVLVAGMLFTGLLGAMLLLMHGRRLRVEELVRQRTAELTQQRQTQQTITDSAADAILLIDADSRIVMSNPAAERLLQTPAALLHAAPLQDWLPAWQPSWLDEARTNGNRGYRGEINLVGRDGTERHFDVTLTAVPYLGREHFCCLLHDLTERVAVEKMKREFVATVSHELRTPLTSIRGSLALLQGMDWPPPPEQAAQLIRIANDNSKRLTLLVNDLLDFEKLEAGKLELTLEPVPVGKLLDDSLREMAGFATSRAITLRQETEAVGDRLIRVSPDRFAQIMNNLISNALKFSPEGSVVTVRARETAGAIQIEVIDQGIGIGKEKQPFLFQKFWQADPTASRRQGGTGLGLAICKRLVELMHGEIGVQSEPGHGSTFWLRFPPLSQPT